MAHRRRRRRGLAGVRHDPEKIHEYRAAGSPSGLQPRKKIHVVVQVWRNQFDSAYVARACWRRPKTRAVHGYCGRVAQASSPTNAARMALAELVKVKR